MPDIPPVTLRIAVVIVALGIWFLTQHLITFRPSGTGVIGDGIHSTTWRLNHYFLSHPRAANILLVSSSLAIDSLGIFVIYQSTFGTSIRPFLGLMICFALRQVCQALCVLPPPTGMIWRSPGVPSLLVTYGVANDLFFSGHTAMAVYGSIELGLWGGMTWAIVGGVLATFEIVTVLVLRAHYTMDVYAGAITAILAAQIAERLAPQCDGWLIRLGQMLWM